MWACPGQPVVTEGEHRTGAALAQGCPRGAVAGGGAVGAGDPHLLPFVVAGLGEGDAQGHVLAGAAVAGHGEFVEGVGPEGRRGGGPASGLTVRMSAVVPGAAGKAYRSHGL